MRISHNGYGYECVLRDGAVKDEAACENHCHPFYEIIMVMSGEISINIENRSFSAGGGGFAIIEPGAYHSVVARDESEYRRIALLFEEFVIPDGVKRVFADRARRYPVGYHRDAAALLSRLSVAMRGEGDEIDDYSELIRAIIVEIFYLVCSESVEYSEGENNRSLQLMLDYIAEHITEKISLDDVAAAALVSKFAVCHIFKSRMHTTFKQYVLQKKISHAAHLIQNGMTAGDAAKTVGYDNYAGFYKVYKKFLLKAPSEKKNRI